LRTSQLAQAGRLALLALTVAAAGAFAQQPAHPAAAIDKKAIEDYLRHLELWIPGIQVRIDDPKPTPLPDLLELPVHLSYGQASKDVDYYISKDGRYILRATIFNLRANPFEDDLKLIHTENQPSFGPADAPLTLVLFSDFECPLCREEAKSLRSNIAKTFPKEVRVVFLDFPLDAIHPWAQHAEAFWDYFDWMYEHQADIKPENVKDKILEWAKGKPDIDSAKLAQCVDMRATEAEVNHSLEEGKKLQVDATPTAFLNGRRLVGNMPWQNLEQIIKLDLEYYRTHSK